MNIADILFSLTQLLYFPLEILGMLTNYDCATGVVNASNI